MLCKYCDKEMIMVNPSLNLYFCNKCGAECIVYEDGQEDWWEKDEIDIKKVADQGILPSSSEILRYV